ncbi:MAG: biopolymer transporter ExbB [Candidatus Nephrothrix sp. EaCA]|nr:MAG: biopolymer transporter ExbB [Candidatus Nephrothrix sp. EaCA]
MNLLLQISTAPEVAPAADQSISFLELAMKGGPVMLPILVLSVATVYFWMERYRFIRPFLKREKDYLEQVIKYIEGSDLNAAKNFSDRASHGTSSVISYGIGAIGKPLREVEAIVEGAANIQVAEMERRLGYLGVIAGVAPMLGFLGTISGIIRIFWDISISNNISIGIIAGGLYEKMIASGSGLLVGVFAYFAYHMLHQSIERYGLYVQKDVFRFLQTIR